MSAEVNTNVKEKIKNFLIVGETLDGIYSFQGFQIANILAFLVLISSTIVSLAQAIQSGSYWWLLVFAFLTGSIYFLLQYRTNITYAITKFRIIRIENDLITERFFKSSRLIGFTDLHYEHVESINIGATNISFSRFYISLVGISLGWFLLVQDTLFGLDSTFMDLVSVLIIVASIINIIFSLPFGGVQMLVQSISGEVMSFPEKETPQDFVDELILNCRTFLSYGAQ